MSLWQLTITGCSMLPCHFLSCMIRIIFTLLLIAQPFFTFPLLSQISMLLCFASMHCISSSKVSCGPCLFLSLPFFLLFSFLLSMPYPNCFCWLWLSLCGCFVAKLEPAVSVSSSVQAPASAAPLPQGPLQVPQPSSLPLGLLTGIFYLV